METKVIELAETLNRTCRELLRSVVLSPETQILDVTVKTVRTGRFDNSRERTCYIVQVSTTDTAMVAGAVSTFKGSYKERIEGALEATIKSLDSDAEVAVDIVGPSGATVEKLLRCDDLELSGKVSCTAPICVTAREFDIPYILIRGRHLVGPNPALAKILSGLLKGGMRPRNALDLFSGTGIATKVVLRNAPSVSITAVDTDEMKTEAMRQHIQSRNAKIVTADAFTMPLEGRFDLVIADPYYEDCVSFLKARGAELRLRATTLVLVGGQIQHESWNDKIRSLLLTHNFRVQIDTLYGQTVFICS